MGFAEGRCDALPHGRAARRRASTTRPSDRAGEDQVLAARLRASGYRVCKAPGLRYFLSVSSDQDSLLKLVRHAELFGRVTPYLLIANSGTVAGVAGASAGPNRTRRTLLRALQLSARRRGWVWCRRGVATRSPARRDRGYSWRSARSKAALFLPIPAPPAVRPGATSPRSAALQPVARRRLRGGLRQGPTRARPARRARHRPSGCRSVPADGLALLDEPLRMAVVEPASHRDGAGSSSRPSGRSGWPRRGSTRSGCRTTTRDRSAASCAGCTSPSAPARRSWCAARAGRSSMSRSTSAAALRPTGAGTPFASTTSL